MSKSDCEVADSQLQNNNSSISSEECVSGTQHELGVTVINVEGYEYRNPVTDEDIRNMFREATRLAVKKSGEADYPCCSYFSLRGEVVRELLPPEDLGLTVLTTESDFITLLERDYSSIIIVERLSYCRDAEHSLGCGDEGYVILDSRAGV